MALARLAGRGPLRCVPALGLSPELCEVRRHVCNPDARFRLSTLLVGVVLALSSASSAKVRSPAPAQKHMKAPPMAP